MADKRDNAAVDRAPQNGAENTKGQASPAGRRNQIIEEQLPVGQVIQIIGYPRPGQRDRD